MSIDRNGATISIGDTVAIRCRVISLESDGVVVCELTDVDLPCSTTLVLNADQLEIVEWLPNT